jgi:hypothetical protein
MPQEARAALEAADYGRAGDLVAQAQRAYAALEDTRQDGVLSAYAERAERGLRAAAALDEAATLAERLSYPQARAAADHAATEFMALGDRARADQALALRALLDQRQSLIGALLLILGLGGVAASAARRLMVREAEAW